MDNEQPTNRTIDATQMERALSKIPCDNLNISCDFLDTTPSYVSFAIRRRRNQRRLRRLRHEITINMYIWNRIRRLPMQTTNNLFTNQFFNGSAFP
ncbi:unnamed protein product [Rhizophagus irregularis]|uniref:Uncharacterized protein n=1 Tax=Rhizophagus irregularis TaxID=588596 RepID=A0A915YTC1_9GLOM|nr:unnamed protein product [Rhizophagus irregularis]CAB5333060.1 unnamed protein product [Rhizophagus irregularis]